MFNEMNNAVCPLDKSAPTDISLVQPEETAPSFVVRECSFDEARIMVRQFHYSGDLPHVVRINFGAYDVVGGALLAVACYGPIVSRSAPRMWLELRRLVRVPETAIVLSQFLASTLRLLKKRKIEAVLSWADPEQQHYGAIYQATNWVYTEQKSGGNHTFVTENGEHIHPRTVYARFGTQSVPVILARNPGWSSFLPQTKHRYLMPLNIRKAKALAQLKTVEKPYPKIPNRDLIR